MADKAPAPPDPVLGALAARVHAARPADGPLIIAITGSVAAGKSTLAAQLAERLSTEARVETVSTDGFLFPNAILETRDLMMRKGFPESYDTEAMAAAIAAVRTGPAVFPAHSHVIYDIDPALARTLDQPDILILEGLGFAPPSPGKRPATEPDLMIYLDAETAHIETWFLDRFMQFWHAAADDPSSFYARFRHMSETEAREFARTAVWQAINLPNLCQHIAPLREQADIVMKKDGDHSPELVRASN